MNRAGLDMIEADSLDQVQGKCVYPLVSEEHRQTFQKAVQDVFRGEPRSLEFTMIGLRGHPRWLFTQAVPLRNDRGDIISALSITLDITARKEAEEKLRQNEEFIRSILDTVDEGFIVIDRNYRIQTANKAYCRQVGLGSNAVVGMPCYQVSHHLTRPCFEEGEECAVRAVFATGEPHAVSHKHSDTEGRLVYVETKAYPMRDDEGRVVSVIETVNNITEKHLLEEERLKTQKLESIGTLAGGIAHDFNNLLQGVFGFISMAKLSYNQREKSLAMLEQAEKALHQSVNLTTQLLTFSKGGKPVLNPLSLRPVIENSVSFALSGSRTLHQEKYAQDLWLVNGDEGQLGQVIQNIILNADQSMPVGGLIKVGAKNVTAPGAAIPPTLPAGDYVLVSIEDSGVGIPEQYLDKVFDPYFTTKEKGSGLGLATSYSIIKNHKGQIAVSSQVGKGTLFRIYLPALSAHPAEAPAATQPAEQRVGKERILVMDDEEIIRILAGEMLRELGHDVDVAADGLEAIGKYREAQASGNPYGIVILDLTIRGGMGGAETIRTLRELDPEVKAVVSSGYSDEVLLADYQKQGFLAYLKKPYDIEELRKIINGLLS